MDMGRLGPALEAGGYAGAWESDRTGGADQEQRKKAAEVKFLAHKLKRAGNAKSG